MSRRPAILPLVLVVLGAPRLAPAQALPRAEAREAGFDPAKLDRIGTALAQAVEAGKIAGGSALVAREGKVVGLYAAGMADREAGRRMADDTIVRIASMSKPVTSVAVLILADEGKLALDDPVSKFVPSFSEMKVLTDEAPHVVPAKGPVTIHQLLTHTAGLTYRFLDKPILSELYEAHAVSDGLSETPGTIGQNVDRLAAIPLMFEPGTAWEYSLATDVLGRVVEVASGRSLDEFFRERIFEPLGMDDTGFVVPEAKRERLAAVYEPGDDGRVRRMTAHPAQKGRLVYSATYPTWDDGHYYSGGAGLVSTLGDYARFLQMLLNRGELDGVRLLRPETVDRMTSNQIGDLRLPDWGHGDRFGYGVGVLGPSGRGVAGEEVGSYSWAGFFYTYFWVDPRDRTLGILFTQTYPSLGLTLREDVKRLTYEARTGGE